MLKKIISLVLALVMICSVAVVAVTAAQVEIADSNEDTPADESVDQTITFDASTTGWTNYKYISFHIWKYDSGEAFFDFGSNQEKGKDNDDGTYTYDLAAKDITLEPGVLYAVIFYNENMSQTYNLLMDASCIGDTAYCDGTVCESPTDSDRTVLTAFWRGQDAPADPISGQTITFDANSTGWTNYNYISFHIWNYNSGEAFFDFGSNQEKGKDNGDGTYTYDLAAKDITLEPGVLYAIIFYNEDMSQTYNLLMGTPCLGDTAYCDGTVYESPTDRDRTVLPAFWRGQDASRFGPEKCITSIGNVVGTCLPSTVSEYSLFVRFLKDFLENARTYSGKDDQTLLDDIAANLGGLKSGDVKNAIAEAGVTTSWKEESSTLEKGEAPSTGVFGDVDGDGKVSVMDATEIQRYKAEIINSDMLDLTVADVDKDGQVTVLDATRIQRYKAQICNLDGTTPYIET